MRPVRIHGLSACIERLLGSAQHRAALGHALKKPHDLPSLKSSVAQFDTADYCASATLNIATMTSCPSMSLMSGRL